MGGNTLGFEYPAFLVDEEQRKLYQNGKRYVRDVAMKYSDRGVPWGTLTQAGCEGLAIAVEKFQHNVEFKYYAEWYIRQSIMKCFNGE